LKEIEIDGHGLVAGSRALVDEESNAERTFIRLVFSKVSNFIVQNICGVKLKVNLSLLNSFSIPIIGYSMWFQVLHKG